MFVLLVAGCDADPVERRKNIYRLQADPTDANVQRLRDMLDDPARDVRASALNVLVGLGVDDAAELSRAALADPDGFVRATAAKLLGDLADPAHATALAEIVGTDSDPMARQRAAEGLARLGGQVALDGLARGLADPMDPVRMACIRGLRELDPGFAKSSLARLLIEDPVWEVRAASARTLGRSPDAEVVAMLNAALDDPNEFVRSAAANALRVHAEMTGNPGD